MYTMFKIEMLGAEDVKQRLTAGIRRVEDMRPGFHRIADDIRRTTRIQFESQGRRGGGQWRALAASTVRKKAARNLDPRIMFARHRLFNSLTAPSSRNADIRIDGSTLVFGSRLPYASRQHYGDANLPARPLWVVLPSDERRWAEIMEDEIEISMGKQKRSSLGRFSST